MRAAQVAVALAEMEVLLRPPETPGAQVVEVLVEMVEMSPFRLATYSVGVVAAVEAWGLVPP